MIWKEWILKWTETKHEYDCTVIYLRCLMVQNIYKYLVSNKENCMKMLQSTKTCHKISYKYQNAMKSLFRELWICVVRKLLSQSIYIAGNIMNTNTDVYEL